MSVFENAMRKVDDELFDVFGDLLTVSRPGGATATVEVVVEHGVAQLGEFGQVKAYVSMASFRNVEWQPRPSDVLTLADGMPRKVEEVERNDGLVTRVVLYG